MKAAHGVDFEDIYLSEIYAGSEPQNTPTTKFFCGPDPPHGIGAYELVLLP